jgi:hypothetical protein
LCAVKHSSAAFVTVSHYLNSNDLNLDLLQ